MGFWGKVIGGAVIGVTAFALGAAKGRWDKKQEQKQCDLERRAGAAKAEYERELEKLKNELASIIRDVEIREQFLVTSFAVGICAANADHDISDEEREELEELAFGLAKTDVLSKAAQKRVEQWYNSPPELATVWRMIEDNGFNKPKYISVFDKIINMVIMADDVKNHHEEEFIEAWNSRVA
ncbi:hypothetical protein [Pseudoalteromonas maricaloris]|uniref:hypothetical protein n=1 Tax=Pseudoalteromonas maricaloris TaxID=184924 RepID=UPI00029AF0F4|nr:hypothetical protein [Pseudoalteromonas flavipulchra]